MANTKQAQKAIRKTRKRTNYNKWWKNQVKTAYKAVLAVITSSESEKIAESVSKLQKKIDKATKSNTIHKNKARRMKSAAMKKAAASKKAA